MDFSVLDPSSFLQGEGLIYAAVPAALAAGGLVYALVIQGGGVPESRLKAVTKRREDLRAGMKAGHAQSSLLRPEAGWLRAVAMWTRQIPSLQNMGLKKKMLQAGIRNSAAPVLYVFFKLVLPLALFLLGLLLTAGLGVAETQPLYRLLLLLGLPGLAFAAPGIWLKNAIQKREEKIRKALPDAFDLLVICAEAGLGLDAALDRVAREIASATPELAEEIGITGVELGFLPDRRMALNGLAERVQLPAMKALINTLVQSEKYGTPLAQALRVLAAELRDERMMKAEEKAAKLPATLTVPMVLFILPTLFIVLMGPAILQVLDLRQ